MKLRALIMLLVFLPVAARAEDTPVAEGTPAPFTGVLLTTDDYAEILTEKAELDKLRVEVEVLRQLDKFKDQKNKELLDLKQLESDAWKVMSEKNAQRSFIEQHGFQLGAALGMLITVLLTFAVVQGFKIEL